MGLIVWIFASVFCLTVCGYTLFYHAVVNDSNLSANTVVLAMLGVAISLTSLIFAVGALLKGIL